MCSGEPKPTHHQTQTLLEVSHTVQVLEPYLLTPSLPACRSSAEAEKSLGKKKGRNRLVGGCFGFYALELKASGDILKIIVVSDRMLVMLVLLTLTTTTKSFLFLLLGCGNTIPIMVCITRSLFCT